MDWSFLKRHHHAIPVLLILTGLTLGFHFWLVEEDKDIQEQYGKVNGTPGPKHSEAIAELMDPSILDYEGEGEVQFGGQDPTFIVVGFAVLLYFLSLMSGLEQSSFVQKYPPLKVLIFPAYILKKFPKFQDWLNKNKIYFSSIFCYMAIGFVFELGWKTIFARPRPGDVDGGLQYVAAWEIGTVSFDDAYHGSFPSGHTFACAVLYIFTFFGLLIKNEKTRKWYVPLSFTAVSVWSALMGWGRVADHAHYASNNLWAIYFAFVYCFFFFFYVFKVPEQKEAGTYQWDWQEKFKNEKWYKKPRRAWEMGLLISILFFQIGCLIIILGVKELVNAAFNLNFPMLTQLLAGDGIYWNAYGTSALMIGIGAILAAIFWWSIKINLDRRPSKVLRQLKTKRLNQ